MKASFQPSFIKIFQTDSPAEDFPESAPKPAFQFLGAERAVGRHMKRHVRLVRKLRDEKVRKAIVVVILKDDAHAGEHFAVARPTPRRNQGPLRKRAVPIVMEKKLIGDVIRHKNIGEAVAIVIGEGDSQAVAFFRCDGLKRR